MIEGITVKTFVQNLFKKTLVHSVHLGIQRTGAQNRDSLWDRQTWDLVRMEDDCLSHSKMSAWSKRQKESLGYSSF